MVHQPGARHDPRVGIAAAVAAALGTKQLRLLLRSPNEQHSLRARETLQVLVHDIVLALSLGEVDPQNTADADEPVHRGAERIGDLRQRGVEATGNPSCWCT
jgi:hypothetical protein